MRKSGLGLCLLFVRQWLTRYIIFMAEILEFSKGLLFSRATRTGLGCDGSRCEEVQ